MFCVTESVDCFIECLLSTYLEAVDELETICVDIVIAVTHVGHGASGLPREAYSHHAIAKEPADCQSQVTLLGRWSYIAVQCKVRATP